jgi:hypothetical protein
MFAFQPAWGLFGVVATPPSEEEPFVYLSAENTELGAEARSAILDGPDLMGKQLMAMTHFFERVGTEARVVQHLPLGDGVRVHFTGSDIDPPNPFLAKQTNHLTISVQLVVQGPRRLSTAWTADRPAHDVFRPLQLLAAWERGPNGEPLYFTSAEAANDSIAGLTRIRRTLRAHSATKFHTPWSLPGFAIRSLNKDSDLPLQLSPSSHFQVSLLRPIRLPRGYLGFDRPGLHKRVSDTTSDTTL